MDEVELQVLGQLRVLIGRRDVGIRSHSQLVLLAVLLVGNGGTVTTDALMEALWGDDPPASAATTLRTHLSRLRGRIGIPRIIVTTGSGYSLQTPPETIDAVRFERLAGDARKAMRSGHLIAGSRTLEEALGLWRGRAFGDLADVHAIRAEAGRLEELRLDVLEERIDTDLRLGRHSVLVGELGVLTEAHPFREHFWGQLMTALYRSGRQADALRAYRKAHGILGEELGIEPSLELRTLEEQILLQDPQLESPTVRSRPQNFSNLPIQLTSFVGRDQEMAEVEKLIRGARLVTLTGAGGSGKTRLALQVATGLFDEFPEGIWVVELGAIEDPELVGQTISTGFGLREQGALSVTDVLHEYLRDRHLLLFVDNCEHLIDETADMVSRLLVAAPKIRVLTTSREPLRVPGEVVYRVPTLRLPDQDSDKVHLLNYDSVRLLVERAEHALPGSRLAETNPVAVSTIVRRLDGIPLAIELAAAQLRTHGADTVATRLDGRHELLVNETRGVPERQQTLRATIDWSYHLLTDDERMLFGPLSVFRGSFDLSAVESVCARGVVGVIHTLGGLVDKSLVLSDSSGGESRFRLLETIREYADGRLNEPDRADLCRRHAIYYVEQVMKAEADRWEDEPAYFELVARDYENFLVALGRSLADDTHELSGQLLFGLRYFWWSRGIPSTARGWAIKALAGIEQMSPLTAALTYLAAGTISMPTDLDMAGHLLESAVAMMEPLVEEDEDVIDNYLAALNTYGAYLWFRGEASQSLKNSERVLDVARRYGHRHHIALSLNNLSVAMVQADPGQAVAFAEEALEIFQEIGPPSRVAEALDQLGEAEWHAGNHAAAEEHLRTGIDLAKSQGHEWEVLEGREILAGLLLEEGRPGEALYLLEESLAAVYGTTSLIGTVVGLASTASRIGAHQTAVGLSALARQHSMRSGHSGPGLMERLNSIESEAKASLSADGFQNAVARGERLDPTDLTEVMYELRRYLGKDGLPPQ